ncbi:MAG: pilus assembly protein TadG-related protein, partial [Anaerolineae bacterium]
MSYRMADQVGTHAGQPSARRTSAQSGQSFVLLAIIFMGLLALLGLALDLGLLYIVRLHMKSALDAATFAG